ncbi:MAG TPA: ECF transporter S component [Armatimonadota bacterium]|jgi:energy-coupling factor transport system substrate-specific component
MVTPNPRPSGPWSLREILLLGSLSAALGVLYQATNVLYDLMKFLDPVGDKLLYGLWFSGGLLIPYILRRPGAAFAGELMSGLVSMFLGAKWGVDVLLSAALQGAACEVVFALGRWRRFSGAWVCAAGAAAGVAALLHDGLLYGYFSYRPPVVIALCATLVLSGALVGGGFAVLVGRGLAATGAIDNTPLGLLRLEARRTAEGD